jgi:hypothetical protein
VAAAATFLQFLHLKEIMVEQEFGNQTHKDWVAVAVLPQRDKIMMFVEQAMQEMVVLGWFQPFLDHQ